MLSHSANVVTLMMVHVEVGECSVSAETLSRTRSKGCRCGRFGSMDGFNIDFVALAVHEQAQLSSNLGTYPTMFHVNGHLFVINPSEYVMDTRKRVFFEIQMSLSHV